MNIENKIVQLILSSEESVSYKYISEILKISIEDIKSSTDNIKANLSNIDLSLIETNTHLSICLSPEISKLLEKENSKDLIKPLSESSLQTLSVIIYKDHVTKAEIDFVRGVDSSRSIKTLLARGLIDRVDNKNKKMYTPSIDTIKYMSLQNINDLKNRKEIDEELNRLMHEE